MNLTDTDMDKVTAGAPDNAAPTGNAWGLDKLYRGNGKGPDMNNELNGRW